MSLDVAMRLADALGVQDLRELIDGAPEWNPKRGGRRKPTKDEEMAAECAAILERQDDADGLCVRFVGHVGSAFANWAGCPTWSLLLRRAWIEIGVCIVPATAWMLLSLFMSSVPRTCGIPHVRDC